MVRVVVVPTHCSSYTVMENHHIPDAHIEFELFLAVS